MSTRTNKSSSSSRTTTTKRRKGKPAYTTSTGRSGQKTKSGNGGAATKSKNTPYAGENFENVQVAAAYQYPWIHEELLFWKILLGVSAIVTFWVVLIFVYAPGFARLLPVFPVETLSICVAYYIVFLFLSIYNIICSFWRIFEGYLIALFINLAALGFTTWIMFTLIYNIVICQNGTLPVSCRDNQLVHYIFLFVTGVLWLTTATAAVASLFVVIHTRNAQVALYTTKNTVSY